WRLQLQFQQVTQALAVRKALGNGLLQLGLRNGVADRTEAQQRLRADSERCAECDNGEPAKQGLHGSLLNEESALCLHKPCAGLYAGFTRCSPKSALMQACAAARRRCGERRAHEPAYLLPMRR